MKKRPSPKSTAIFSPILRKPREATQGKLGRFRETLFEPVDSLPLGIFRFLFGFFLALEFLVVSRETFPHDYILPSFHFTYPLFDFLGLKPLSQPSLWLIFDALRISTIGIMLGLLTRISVIVFTATFGYFFFLESSVYTNHYYLIFLLSFLLCFGHSGSIFSLDSVIRRNLRRDQVSYWEIFLLRFQICVVFFFGALAKMNADWLIHAAPLYLNLIKHFSFLGYPIQEKWIAFALSWGGMLSDLGLGILLATGRWPRLTFIWLCLFNGLNIVFFGLGIKTFPYLMISTYILFLPTPVVRETVGRFLGAHFTRHLPRGSQGHQESTPVRRSLWVVGFVIVYAALQISIPLRYLLYKRDILWTHEGSNFSWRMMADHHETNGGFTIEDSRTKDIYNHSPEGLLSDKQLVMVNNPYMLFQYIQFLKRYLKQQTDIKDPIIRADIQMSVNGRPFQYMYDPTCNLSEVSYSPFKDLKWIIPFKRD